MKRSKVKPETESQNQVNDELSSLIKHYDDSSDEDDNYQELEPTKFEDNIKKFVADHPDYDASIPYILEDQGRRFLYNKEARSQYLKNKPEQSEEEISENIKNIDFAKILTNALQQTYSSFCPPESANQNRIKRRGDKAPTVEEIRKKQADKVQNCTKEILKKYKTDILGRLILKQSNKEFVLPEFQDAANEIINNIVDEIIVHKKQLKMREVKKEYQISAEKLLDQQEIKNALYDKAQEKLKTYKSVIIKRQEMIAKQTKKLELAKEKRKKDKNIKAIKELDQIINDCEANIKEQEKAIIKILDEVEEFFGKWTSGVGTFLRSGKLDEKCRTETLKALVSEKLSSEITEYLEDGFIDKPKIDKNLKNSFLLETAINTAKVSGIESIKNCTSELYSQQNNDDSLKSSITREVVKKFGAHFSQKLRKTLEEKGFKSLTRKILKDTYIDNTEIQAPDHLIAKEHLLYNSVKRQGRNRDDRETARTVTFDDDANLSVQKSQKVWQQGNKNTVLYRGALQEEVFNLGNYDVVLEKLKTLDESDAGSAIIIRTIFQEGTNCLTKYHWEGDEEEEKWSESLSDEQKRVAICLTELFFGTEGFRSPSAIVEVNMALDLVIDGEYKWEDLLTKKKTVGKGGDLSLTMKATEGAGGTECGRKLSEDVNKYHDRMHKYGGEAIEESTVGYREFIFRKVELVKKWTEWQDKKNKTKTEVPSTSTSPKIASKLVDLIKGQDQNWYGRSLS
jgi:hypothetical protein